MRTRGGSGGVPQRGRQFKGDFPAAKFCVKIFLGGGGLRARRPPASYKQSLPMPLPPPPPREFCLTTQHLLEWGCRRDVIWSVGVGGGICHWAMASALLGTVSKDGPLDWRLPVDHRRLTARRRWFIEPTAGD